MDDSVAGLRSCTDGSAVRGCFLAERGLSCVPTTPVADRAAMGSRRAAAAGAVLVVCLVMAATLNPAGQAHAAELVAGTGSEVSLDQLEAPAEQQAAAQDADAADATATQPDAAVRPTAHGSWSPSVGGLQ